MNDDLHDPQIASMLGRASGAYPDANVAYVAVRGRVRQARRRRAFVAGSAACAMFIGVAAVAAQAGGSGSQLTPSGTLTTLVDDTKVSSTAVETTAVDTSDTVEDSSSSVETTTADTATTIADSGSSGNGGNSGNGGTTATSGTTGSSTSNSSGSSTKPTVPAGPQVQDSAGGSLAFSNDGGTLTFVTATPADGFHEDTNARVVEPHRVRVEFTDGRTTWRIEIRTEGGKMPIEVTQHG